MSKIFYLLNLLSFIISEEINQWNYTENILFYTEESYSTSLTPISPSSTSYYIFTSKTEEEEENIFSTEFEQTWEYTNVTLSPESINLYDRKFIIFSENDKKFYYYIRNSKASNLIPYEIDDDPNILRLKGFQLEHTSYFLIALIGTNKIYSYKGGISSISLKKDYTINLKIINIYNTSSSGCYDYIYIYSYINETTTELAKYKYSSTTLNKEFSIIFPVQKLYNITEISKAIDKEYSFLIFSYNKNEKDFYFYSFNYTNPNNVELISFGNKYNFWPFRDAIILNAFFLKDTEYLYYLIIKDGIYNAGVLDVYNNLIIFNIKKDFIQFISIDNTTLIYGINNIVYCACPFKSINQEKCSPSLNINSMIVIYNFDNKVIQVFLYKG